MRPGKALQRIDLAVVELLGGGHVLGHPLVRMPELVESFLLALHGGRRLHPAVVVHGGVQQPHPQLAVVGPPKTLRVAVRLHPHAGPHNADFAPVPAVRIAHVVVGTVEMAVVQQQALHGFIILPLRHTGPDGGVIGFVQHLVGLQVNGPVGIGGHSSQGLVGFHGQHPAALAQAVVPHGFNNANFGRTNALNQTQCAIVGVSHGHHHLIAQRQQRVDALQHGVIVLDGIANKGEADDFHVVCHFEHVAPQSSMRNLG